MEREQSVALDNARLNYGGHTWILAASDVSGYGKRAVAISFASKTNRPMTLANQTDAFQNTVYIVMYAVGIPIFFVWGLRCWARDRARKRKRTERLLPSEQWSDPKRTGGQDWKN
jgi:hypothetical protein